MKSFCFIGLIAFSIFLLYNVCRPSLDIYQYEVFKTRKQATLWSRLVVPATTLKHDDKLVLDKLIFGIPGLPNNNQDIITYIRKFHLSPPKTNATLNISEAIMPTPATVMSALKEAIGDRTGFFVECGANDGEFLSNTLELENKFGWHGLLIEASPTLFPVLKMKGRNHSWTSDVCLSTIPEQLVMYKWKNYSKHDNYAWWAQGVGRLKTESVNPLNDNFDLDGRVNCFPLVSLLHAMNVTLVDFLSLDVEGNEYKVLAGFPFDQIEIKVIQTEWINVPEGKEALQNLMMAKGYHKRPAPDGDIIYIKGATADG